MNATAITHTISTRKVLRHVPHHHRGPQLNRRHAVNAPGVQVRDGERVPLVCGGTAEVEEFVEVLGADGGPVYNCVPAADAGDVTCKDCRRKLGL